MKAKLLLFALFGFLFSFAQEYYPDRLIIKVKDEFREQCSNDNINLTPIQSILNGVQGAQIKKIYPNHVPKRGKTGEITQEVDLSLIYQFTFSDTKDPADIAEFLSNFKFFEYAEVRYINTPLYTPDDPDIASQWHLATVKAFEAWDTEQGDASVVIGITDTGYDLDHPDLQNAIAYNTADPIDGIDNDGNGKIDDYHGWDTGDDDNDPSVDGNNHGIMVAGVAGAVTDNTNQIAGSGFNCKLLPIKIMDGSGQLSGDYEAIIYAADQGCDIINASWGGAGAATSYGQDVITYASIDKRALVVCAAGNSNDEGVFYPASYEWALSVGGTEQDDSKWINNGSTGSNYNEHVDIVAPSVDIFTVTNGGGTIGSRWGTSFAAPLVAGAAALVKSQNPTWWGIQVGEQLKATADIIDTMGVNSAYVGKLGEGRLNMESSVSVTGHPGFIFTELAHTDNGDGRYIYGDTIDVTGELYNFLSPSSPSATATLVAHNPNTTVISSPISAGGITTFSGIVVSGTPFQFEVTGNPSANEVAGFTILMEDGNYNTHHYFEVALNTDYFTYSPNNITTSLTKTGKIGFNDGAANKQGVGLSGASNNNWLFQAGVIAGTASNQVSFSLENEFANTEDFTQVQPGLVSNYDVHVAFDDQPANNPIGIEVNQTTYGWNDDATVNDWIMLEYTIKNTSGSQISGLKYGIYADWDIQAYQQNQAAYDSTHRLAYAYHATAGYAGIHMVDTTYAFHHYALENPGSNGSINIYDGFSESEQYAAISAGNARSQSVSNTDISHVLAAEIGDINAGDSAKVTFVIVTGTDLADIQSQSISADSVYNSIHSVELSAAVQTPACFEDCNGNIKVAPVKGVAPYRYTWIGEPSFEGDSVGGLCAGTYEIAVVDTLGNKDTLTYVLAEPTVLSSAFVDTIPDNGSCNGSIGLNVAGGTAPYTFAWTNGSDSTRAVSLCTGDHSVIITDSLGCVLNDTVTIDLVTSVQDLTGNNVSVFPNPSNGMFQLSVEGFIGENLAIFSADGRLVEQLIINNAQEKIDLSAHGKGVYFIRITSIESKVMRVVIR